RTHARHVSGRLRAPRQAAIGAGGAHACAGPAGSPEQVCKVRRIRGKAGGFAGSHGACGRSGCASVQTRGAQTARIFPVRSTGGTDPMRVVIVVLAVLGAFGYAAWRLASGALHAFGTRGAVIFGAAVATLIVVWWKRWGRGVSACQAKRREAEEARNSA